MDASYCFVFLLIFLYLMLCCVLLCYVPLQYLTDIELCLSAVVIAGEVEMQHSQSWWKDTGRLRLQQTCCADSQEGQRTRHTHWLI